MAPAVVDTIAHVFEPASDERPHAGTAVHLGAPVAAEDLLVAMDGAGVDKLIQVTPSTLGFDNRHSLEVASAHPDRVRVVARVDTEAPDVPERMAALAGDPLVVGVRVTLGQRQAVHLGGCAPFWEAAEALQVPVEVYASGAVAAVVDVARRYPRLALMLDHAGREWGSHAPFAGWPDLGPLVALANVSVRISGLPELCGERYPFPTAQGYVRDVVTMFGADRVMWGSNHPASSTAGAYAELVDYVRKECTFMSPAQVDDVLGGTALRVMRLEAWA